MQLHKSRKEDIPANLNAMSHTELQDILVNYLESKRYLVVLDDVWDNRVWKEIRVSLLDQRLRSRIILTTRKEDIASSSFGVESRVHYIQPLQKNDAWELFRKKAFSTNHYKACPPELDFLARGLVEKCEGLPLTCQFTQQVMEERSNHSWGTSKVHRASPQPSISEHQG
ncbi:hypothetical protein ACLB2K_023616 [Fragaria x ananassa]